MSIPLAARAYPVECRSHMDVYRERQLSGFPSAFHHARDAHAAERLAALIHEDVGDFRLLLPMQAFEADKFIALKIVGAVSAALEPAHDDRPFGQVNIVPAKVTSLADTESVSIDQQADEPMRRKSHCTCRRQAISIPRIFVCRRYLWNSKTADPSRDGRSIPSTSIHMTRIRARLWVR